MGSPSRAASSPILLVDTDEGSPARGKLYPTVATTPPADDFVPDNLLAIAPRPGFVLVGKRKYAFVVLRAGHSPGEALAQEARHARRLDERIRLQAH